MTGVGTAPGRLDVMGGVADYSGALVLETPITRRTTVRVEPADAYAVSSEGFGEVRLAPGDLATQLAAVPRWGRYVLGCARVFMEARAWKPAAGLRFRVESTVPVAMGVSSSAALEIATLRALADLTGTVFEGTEIAHFARRAEHDMVGVPCGLMDQLACAFGQSGTLLAILCRPDVLLDPVPLPTGIVVVGWPSGMVHDVGGTAYRTARTAAFMGKRLAELTLERPVAYTADLSDTGALPASLSGRVFLELAGGVDDPLSTVHPDREYPVRAAASFAVEEHGRCRRVIDLLAAERLEDIGAEMRASHEGYGTMGLGSPETDRLVRHVERLGPREGFYGARVSGGGCGGTVVVLAEERAIERLPADVIR